MNIIIYYIIKHKKASKKIKIKKKISNNIEKKKDIISMIDSIIWDKKIHISKNNNEKQGKKYISRDSR